MSRCAHRTAPRHRTESDGRRRDVSTAALVAGLGTLLAGAPASSQVAVAAPAGVQTVVVSATRHAMPLADAPAAMSVIDAEAIAERGADNLLQALRGEPGVTLFGRTISGRKGLSLRGMDPRHTLVLVDGRRISASDGVIGHSDFQLDWAGPADIDRIEVVRGPMSVLYGGEALGGVVNIITRPLPDRREIGLLAEGSHGHELGGSGHRAALSLRGPVDEQARLRLGASAADSRRGAVQTTTDPLIDGLEGRHKQEASLRLHGELAERQWIEVEARLGDEQRWGGVRERSGRRRYHESFHDLQRRHVSAAWNAEWGGAMRWETQLRAYGSRLAVENEKTNGVASLRPNTLADRVIDGQASFAPAAAHRLTGGFELREEQLDNAGLPGGNGQASYRALYLQDEFQAGKTLALTFGLRADHHDTFGSELSPRAYAVWRVAPQWVVKGGIGHGFKPPTLKQITAGYQEDEGPNTFFGNPALVPEVNDSAELGLGWDSVHAGASAMVFHNRVRHLIVPVLFGNVAGRDQYRFENIDRGVMKGLETAAHWRHGAWTLGVQYTYVDARDDAGRRLERRPRHQAGVRADWRGERWRAGASIEHQGGMLMPAAVPGAPPQPVPDLTFVGLHGAVRLAPGLDLRLGVDNLTDVRLSEKSALYTYADSPRTWRVGLHGSW